MNEELLYHVWKFGLTSPNLLCTANSKIQVIHPGTQNFLSGPDFKNSKIKVENQTWVGNVEIHVKSSDWLKHGHSGDKAYDSIILHVVFENDIELEEHVFRKVPTLELKKYIDTDFLSKYNSFKAQQGWIPCESKLNDVDEFYKNTWLERLKIERVERKTHDVENILTSLNGDWESTFMVWLFRSYGFKFNADPMEWLAKKVKLRILVNSINVEALIFGLAGILPEVSNDFYVNQLIKDFEYEKIKWKLEPLEKAVWKTGKVRPPNQPAIRLAQIAAVLSKCRGDFWSIIANKKTIVEIKELFQTAPNSYWEEHYSFDKSVKKHRSHIGDSSFELIMINSIIPFLFIFGKIQNKPALVQKAIVFLEELKSESNSVIENWRKLGQKTKNAGDSQALLELYNEYCSVKKCLICAIGNKLLRQ